MDMLSVSEAWRAVYPGAVVGALVMSNLANPEHHPGLEEQKRALESELRARYGGLVSGDLKALERARPYVAYYKRFDKSYHVLLQLESVALKGKSLPSVAALVETMFLAELKNLLLTAGHDLDVVRGVVAVDVAKGTESYLRLNGQEQTLKTGDMFISDAEGILSSIIYGPDNRTRITSATTSALFTVYAPPGITQEAVQGHLEDIRDYALLVAPNAEVRALEVHAAT